jgi:hypothetical protein
MVLYLPQCRMDEEHRTPARIPRTLPFREKWRIAVARARTLLAAWFTGRRRRCGLWRTAASRATLERLGVAQGSSAVFRRRTPDRYGGARIAGDDRQPPGTVGLTRVALLSIISPTEGPRPSVSDNTGTIERLRTALSSGVR